MKLRVISVGEPHEGYAIEGKKKYEKLISKYHSIVFRHPKVNSSLSRKIEEYIKGSFVVLVDEVGKQFSSRELANFLSKQALHGQPDVSFLIGGPDGHSEEVKKLANISWSLSNLTLPHDMALIMVLESLYRASTINAGHPYHRS